MVLSTPESNIDDVMRYFQAEISKEMRKKTKTQLYRFSGRYKWVVIENELQYLNVYRYVFRNPLEAGIVKLVEDYQFSSLYGQLGRATLAFPIYEWPNKFLDQDLFLRTEFINDSLA